MCADALPEGLVMLGPALIKLSDVGPHASKEICLQFLALQCGILQLPDILLLEGEPKKLLDTLSLNITVK